MELRTALANAQDLEIIWVMADNQINEKSLRFSDELGLRERVRFASDRGSAAIDRLGIRLDPAEAMEAGVPLPTTYLLDREGKLRFVDVRRDFHIGLDASVLVEALAALPRAWRLLPPARTRSRA